MNQALYQENLYVVNSHCYVPLMTVEREGGRQTER